jgi:hypothetical protein
MTLPYARVTGWRRAWMPSHPPIRLSSTQIQMSPRRVDGWRIKFLCWAQTSGERPATGAGDRGSAVGKGGERGEGAVAGQSFVGITRANGWGDAAQPSRVEWSPTEVTLSLRRPSSPSVWWRRHALRGTARAGHGLGGAGGWRVYLSLVQRQFVFHCRRLKWLFDAFVFERLKTALESKRHACL